MIRGYTAINYEPSEENPAKVKRARSTGNQIITSFFGRTSIAATIALPPKSIVNVEWYTAICLPGVLRKVREIRPRSSISFDFDNAQHHIVYHTTE